jgi:membrane-associated phospholipid phosphatase
VYFRIIHRSWKFIFQITVVLVLATLTNIALKRVINRARPTLEHLVPVNTLSYPSGHSMSAMAFYGFLIFLSARYTRSRWKRILFIAMLSILILSIGLSRIYLGVHFPSDVVAGFVGGLIWVAFCMIVFSLFDLWRKGRKKPDVV